MEQLTGSKLRKGSNKVVYCHPIYLYAEHIIWNAGLNELQAGIKISGRNISNLRYADDTILIIIESEETLKSSLMRVREQCEKAGLKLIIKKKKKTK